MNDAQREGPMRVGYILKMFPRLSETFILNEILELERQGCEVSVFSLMYPADGRFHGRLGDLKLQTRYFPRDKPEVYWEQLHGALREHAPPMARWSEAVEFLRKWRIPKDLELLLRAVVIAAQMRSLGIQHIHAHFATVSTRVAAVVNMLTGIPFSFTSHAKDIFRETVDWKLYDNLLERAAFNVTVSDDNERHIRARLTGADPGKVVRLYNGIDLDFFAVHDVPAAKPARIVSVGRLVPKKGFDVLLRALRLWRDRGGEFEAVLVGDGEQEDSLHALCEELQLAEVVTFTGALPQEEVRRLIGEATCTALACVADQDGNRDALPTALLESLALGVPMVSTRLSGIPEILGEEGGMLVEPGDAEGFSRALEALVERLARGEVDRSAVRSRAEKLFDLRTNAGELYRKFRQGKG